MSNPISGDLSRFSMLDLFRSEADMQTRILGEGLLTLERDATDVGVIEAMMRAAHSIKGAASIVDLPQVVTLAHQMEDVFVAAQGGAMRLSRPMVDALLAGVDLLVQISQLSDAGAPEWFASHDETITQTAATIATRMAQGDAAESPAALEEVVDHDTFAPASGAITGTAPAALVTASISAELPAAEPVAIPARADSRSQQSLKVNVENLDRLLSLTSQAVVSAHMLAPLLQSMQRFKKKQGELFTLLDDLQQNLATAVSTAVLKEQAAAILHAAMPLKQDLLKQQAELETHQRRLLANSQTTLDEVLALRMRPLKDGVHALPRMVRDLSHSLGKDVRLEIFGENTPVDRDILVKIESPINHLLRNAIDHGIEMPAQREAAGKTPQGTITISARHAGGMLHIDISDDGQGVDLERIRRRVVERNMATEAMAAALSEAELLDFLFLPAFSLKDTTSIISGRGVGLDLVQETIRQQYGTVQIESVAGKGMKTSIVLPLTQSVVRALITEVGGEAYAIPIAKIDRVLRVSSTLVHMLEDKPFFTLDGQHLGLVEASQVLGLAAGAREPDVLSVVVIGSGSRRYALVVDVIAGEQSLAVQPLEPTFGKMRDIAAGALLESGLPVLVLEVADLLLSIDKLLSDGRLKSLHGNLPAATRSAKRILVVDDSLTVREMERNLLLARGFAVDVAVDGVDGWNAVRSAHYDLVITDVDMPRMDGIELVTLVKKDPRLHTLPVMIVSYKDRPEDRARGIQAGADYYLTKGSFHDETLLDAVIDLIGEHAS